MDTVNPYLAYFMEHWIVTCGLLLGVGLLGFVFLMGILGHNYDQLMRKHEQAILEFAKAHEGRITIPEIVTHCQISVADIQETLEYLTTAGVVETQLDEMGSLIYYVPVFKTAKPPPMLDE